MGFDRNHLPEPTSYFESQDLRLIGPRSSAWKTTECRFHGGSDSMRIKVSTGAFVCMACGARGGDVVAYEMALHGIGFVEAAKRLDAWVGGYDPQRHIRPNPLSARDALSVLTDEATLIAIEGMRMSSGVVPSAADLERIRRAAARVRHIQGMFA